MQMSGKKWVYSCMVSRAYHSANFDIAVCEESARICYVLLPDGLVADARRWAEEAAPMHQCTIALISGMDWNRDMTPWSAQGVMKKEKDFGGGASMYIRELETDLIPNIEQLLKIKASRRYLMGISLSGLFSVWSIFKSSIFNGIGSISGSFWFDGFTDFLEKWTPLSQPRVFMTLGVKEKNSSDKRLATVEDKSNDVVRILNEKNVPTILEMVPGTHFSPFEPRFNRALSNLLEGE